MKVTLEILEGRTREGVVGIEGLALGLDVSGGPIRINVAPTAQNTPTSMNGIQIVSLDDNGGGVDAGGAYVFDIDE